MRFHYLGGRVHSRKEVHLDKDMEMVYIEVVYVRMVVLGSNCVGIVDILCMVQMVHMVVGMVDMDYGHMKMFDCRGLVSMVVQSCVEEGVIHRHMTVVVGSHKKVHHIHYFGMHHGIALARSTLERVIAMEVVHKLEAPPTFDCPILDACSHCSFYSLQHNLNQTHSQRGENS
ncbi:hypothetical protein AHAS_Ahas09G0210200 [Arachis hypogaea]